MRTDSHRALLLLSTILVVFFHPLPRSRALSAQIDHPSELSAAQLRSGIGRSQSIITAFRVVYLAKYNGEAQAAGVYLLRTVAAKSPCFFFHESAHGSSVMPWQDDPLRRRCYIVPSSIRDEWVTVDEWVFNRSYNFAQLEPEGGLPASMPPEFWVQATGMWPLDGRTAPRFEDGPIVLREIAECEEYSLIRARQELCDERWCHVLERPGRDRLWIDVQRGFSLVARELLDKDTGELMQRFQLQGHREIKPAIWLPTRIRSIQFDFRADTPRGRQRRVRDSSVDVLTAQVNDGVAIDSFRFVPADGALWLNAKSGHPVQTSAGGEEHLQHLVDWAKKYGSVENQHSSTLAMLLPFGCLLAAILLLEVSVSRKLLTLKKQLGRP